MMEAVGDTTSSELQPMRNNATTHDVGDLTAILPIDVDGYRPCGEDGRYGHDTLCELLNGGSEVYRSLNVRAVISRTYAKTGAPEVLVDAFDMGSSNDAYGAYHHDMREGPCAHVGRESELAGSSLFFWKHRYFVSVVALGDTPESRAGVIGIANAVATKIERCGEIPDIVGLIPQRGLIASQVHYFHTWQLLNRYRRFANEDLLDLAADTEGVLARYRHAEDASAGPLPSLLVVRYPTAERARAARRRFAAGTVAGRDADVTPLDANTSVGLLWRDKLIIGVFDTTSQDQVQSLLIAVERRRVGKS